MPYRILFVCYGNICRSPAAEEIFRCIVEKEGLSDQLKCDSAGMIDLNEGHPPDVTMSIVARRRGYHLQGRSRKFKGEIDFQLFDMIVTMDEINYSFVLSQDTARCYHNKVKRMIDYLPGVEVTEIPDPYNGKVRDFELVFDLLETACHNLLNETIRMKNLVRSMNTL